MWFPTIKQPDGQVGSRTDCPTPRRNQLGSSTGKAGNRPQPFLIKAQGNV
jgi:hypothetical protein